MINRVIENWKSPEFFKMPVGVFRENVVSKGRRFMSYSEAEFRKEAFAAFNINEVHEEPMFRNFIGNHT